MNIYRYRAIAALTAAGVAWGTTVPLSKVALEWVSPGWLAFVRFGVAAAVLLTVLVSGPGRTGQKQALRAAFRLPVLASGALGYGGSVVLQNAGIARTSVTHAALLIGAAPILVAIIALLWRRTVSRPVAWAGSAVSLIGVGVITGGQPGGASVAGDGMVLLSVLLMAGATVAQGRFLEGMDPVAVTVVQFTGAAVATLPLAGVLGGAPAVPSGGTAGWAALAVLGLAAGGTLLPFTLYAYGQRRVPSEIAGAFLNLEPFVGAIAGIVVFGDPAGARQVAGGTAILAGITLSSLPGLTRHRVAAAPALFEAPEHEASGPAPEAGSQADGEHGDTVLADRSCVLDNPSCDRLARAA